MEAETEPFHEIGGFIGSISRFLLSQYLAPLIAYPTAVINLVGSFCIGIFLAYGQGQIGESKYLFLVPGILGGFTTYSAFSGETLTLLKNQSYSSAIIYVCLTVFGGLMMTGLGWIVGNR